mmetsp:Transcript_38071/g.79780  ORF Transcript_38071/g.79780 Transcript_38071/m.79780 type:complete len:316 (-) Transcript_38071:194-1141(-)
MSQRHPGGREDDRRSDGSGLLRALLQFERREEVLQQRKPPPVENEGYVGARTLHGAVPRGQDVDGRTVLHANRFPHDVPRRLGRPLRRHAGEGSVGQTHNKPLSPSPHRRPRGAIRRSRAASLRSSIRHDRRRERDSPTRRHGKLRRASARRAALRPVRRGGIPRGVVGTTAGRAVRSVPPVHIHGGGDHPLGEGVDVGVRYIQSDVQRVGASLGDAVEEVQQAQVLGEFASRVHVRHSRSVGDDGGEQGQVPVGISRVRAGYGEAEERLHRRGSVLHGEGAAFGRILEDCWSGCQDESDHLHGVVRDGRPSSWV